MNNKYWRFVFHVVEAQRTHTARTEYNAVFSLRIGSHSPIWASDSKVNLPGWKISQPDFVTALVCVNNMYHI